MGRFSSQGLANIAWAFATVGESAPSLLGPVSVLDAHEVMGAACEVMQPQYVVMATQGLVVTNQTMPASCLLARIEACELLFQGVEDSYQSPRTLLEAYRAISDSDGGLRVQATVERLDLIADAPAARALEQGLEAR